MRAKLSQMVSRPAFVFKLCYILGWIMSAFQVMKQIADRMACELQLSFTWDTPIYWAVGRGILNGLKPYSDLFETKPPGIFLLSALSFALSDDVFICNVFCFFCLLVIGLTPLLAAFLFSEKLLWGFGRNPFFIPVHSPLAL